jgi:hypothetical protein
MVRSGALHTPLWLYLRFRRAAEVIVPQRNTIDTNPLVARHRDNT